VREEKKTKIKKNVREKKTKIKKNVRRTSNTITKRVKCGNKRNCVYKDFFAA